MSNEAPQSRGEAAFRGKGLTTSAAPFIESERALSHLFIRQPYDFYSAENHATWHKLFERMVEPWKRYGNHRFLEGLSSLCLDPDHVPRIEDVNRFLEPLTGFKAKPVSGYVPAFIFFDCLRKREFPTTITIRNAASLDYLPEPDIFHDISGHVPMHTDSSFADALVRFGDCAHTAAEICEQIKDESERLRKLESIVKGLARFFWFTIEFGLMNTNEGVRAYGSGLLSSYGELGHAVASPNVQRFPIQLEWVINQGFEIDHFQPLLFVVDGFDHLFSLVGELEAWMREGKLDYVAPGEPKVDTTDLMSFFSRANPAD